MTEVISVENVSKKFIIHHERHRSFQDVVVNLFRSNGSREEFWALQNVSFGVRKGETVGIIGQNGSGKSTVLKLISRIIEPTAGKVAVSGTMSSLLELGAGFHPELTGRENVFLNGSLLGFSRRQMENKFDEIVDFAELWQFIDVPVKRYSSGMYTRLAFAVAINVDPDILLIDEVLSVGDKAFQDKCLERIADFQKRGKTILFVSHSLETVKNICTRVIWLDRGKIRSAGESKKVVLEYLREVEAHEEAGEREEHRQPSGNGRVGQLEGASGGGVKILDLKVLDKDGTERRAFSTGDDVVVRFRYDFGEGVAPHPCILAVSIADANGLVIHRTQRAWQTDEHGFERSGVLELRYAALPLLEGLYTLSVAARPVDAPEMPLDAYQARCRFAVRANGGPDDAIQDGVVALEHEWHVPSPACPDTLTHRDGIGAGGRGLG